MLGCFFCCEKYRNIIFPNESMKDKAGLIHEIRRLFVTGTTGAFFAAFTHSIPLIFPLVYHCNKQGTVADFILRCLFLIWFIGYFNTSYSQKKDGKEWKDVAFDIIQSLIGLTAAYWMGFINHEKYIPFDHIAYTIFGLSVIGICSISFGMFGMKSRSVDIGIIKGKDIDRYMNITRGIAASIAIILIAVTFMGYRGYVGHVWFLLISYVIFVVLLIPLWLFVRVTYLKGSRQQTT